MIAELKLVFSCDSETNVHPTLSAIFENRPWHKKKQRIIPQLKFGTSQTFEVEVDLRVRSSNRPLDLWWCSSNLRRHLPLPWLQISNLDAVFQTRRVPVHSRIQLAEFSCGSLDCATYKCHFAAPFTEQEAQFEHDCLPGKLSLHFASPSIAHVHYMQFLYSDIVCVIAYSDDVYFLVKCPGRIFVAKPSNGPVCDLSQVDERTSWIRARSIPGVDASVVGSCRVFKIRIPDRETRLEVLSGMQHSGEVPVYWGQIGEVQPQPGAGNYEPPIRTREFDCLYAWKCFLSRGFQVTDFLTEDFIGEIEASITSSWNGPGKVEKTLYFLTGLVDRNFIWFSFSDAFKYYFHQHLTANPWLLVPTSFPNFRYIRKVIVTPTRILFLRPELMHDNRIMRRYCFDYALRLCFRDEDTTNKLSAGFTQFSPDFLDHVVVGTLTRGLVLFGRRYEFLLWSNSQLREHSVWMYARDPDDLTVEDIRNDAGDFSGTRSVPKFCARFSQCLTQTEEAWKIEVDFEGDVVSFEPDITDRRGEYTFSDGIGRISPDAASKIWGSLKSVEGRCRGAIPSAFQIRYRGCKGVLAVDPRLDGEKIVFRDSQKKFDTYVDDENSCVVEIVKYSQPSKLKLNRPMIAILEHLRKDIPHGQDVFHELHEKHLMAISEMLLYEQVAVEQLKVKSKIKLGYSDLREKGVSFTTEPFFREVLLAINRKANLNLAEKARIEIPAEVGRNFLGVLDETRQLQYGQVFIQYSVDTEKPGERTRILKGKVIVTKSPCMHPGDIRVFHAVDKPELHHLVDVIVFPLKGPRPHTDEMGGGDLDGDEYQAVWLPELLFHRNEPPMHFVKGPQQEQHQPITVQDMIQWFKTVVEDGPQLGIIANAHMSHADLQGLNSHICASLAAKYSFAVDFQKTGYIEKIKKEERVKSYPDFMGKRFNTHRSKKVLGQLYRKASRIEQLSMGSVQHTPKVQLDQQLVHPDWGYYWDVACRDRDAYFQEVQDIMGQYGIASEAELISGNILHMDMVLMERNELYDTEKVLMLLVNDLQRKYKAQFYEEFNDDEEFVDVDELQHRMLAKASAYYVVTNDQDIENPNKTNFLSFPWVVVGDFLSELKSHGVVDNEDAPLSEQLDDLILESHIGNLLPLECEQFLMMSDLYDENMVLLLSVLIRWAEMSKLFFPESPLNPYVIVALVLQCYNYEDLELENFESVGKMCLKVIQHWASERFRNNQVHLTEFYVIGLLPKECYQPNQIRKLFEAAFETFHRIAISGRFSVLHLPLAVSEASSEGDGLDVGEFKRFQIRLSYPEHYFCSQAFYVDDLLENYDTLVPLIEEKVMNVTGMQSVEIRIVGEPEEVVWSFSGRGSLKAREMLKDTLVSKEIFIQLLAKGLSAQEVEDMIAKLKG